MTDNKSINASNSTETPVFATFGAVFAPESNGSCAPYSPYGCLTANTGYDSSVNPTHCTETGI
jgi:hypothetical protein